LALRNQYGASKQTSTKNNSLNIKTERKVVSDFPGFAAEVSPKFPDSFKAPQLFFYLISSEIEKVC
jgi:hypothetical protein